ncbi:hypothetical protein Tco_0960812, partial [Tanacetum coccineum]
MSSYNQRECVGCGQPCDGFYCHLCTCQQGDVNLINGICLNCTYGDGKPATCYGCEGPLNGGFCSFCASRAGNSFAYDLNPNSFDDSQNLSDYPPQPQYQTYSCKLCGNDAHYGYDSPPQVPFVYNQDPCFDQNFDNFPQTLPSFQQQILCCENCRGPHATFECKPMNQNFHDSNSFGFDQFQPPQFPVIHQPPQEMRMEALHAREDLMKSIQNFLKKFNRISFRETPEVLMQAWDKFFKVKHAQSEEGRDRYHFWSGDLSIPSGIESDNYNLEGDDNSTSLPEFESFHVDYPDSGDSNIDVVEDIPVDVPNIFPTHTTLHMDFDFLPSHNDLGSDLDVSSPSGDRNKINDPGICIKVESKRFLATLSPVIDTLLPFSSKNKDKVFNH